MTEYSKRDIAKIIERSHRNITYWTDFGIVIPDVQPSQGRGVARIYSERNLIEFGMVDIMVKDYGISLDSIRYILKILREGSFSKPMTYDYSGKEKYEIIHFHDFYKNSKWGKVQELLYIEDLYLVNVDIHKQFRHRSAECYHCQTNGEIGYIQLSGKGRGTVHQKIGPLYEKNKANYE